jgi:hypothetical protein
MLFKRFIIASIIVKLYEFFFERSIKVPEFEFVNIIKSNLLYNNNKK